MATATATVRASGTRRRWERLAAVAAAAPLVVAGMIAVSLAGVRDRPAGLPAGAPPAGAADVAARFAGILSRAPRSATRRRP